MAERSISANITNCLKNNAQRLLCRRDRFHTVFIFSNKFGKNLDNVCVIWSVIWKVLKLLSSLIQKEADILICWVLTLLECWGVSVHSIVILWSVFNIVCCTLRSSKPSTNNTRCEIDLTYLLLTNIIDNSLIVGNRTILEWKFTSCSR